MTTLGVFFTRGVSLRQWVESGLFDREVLIYHVHLDSEFFSKIYWFTYGDNDESQAKELHASGRLSRKIEVVECPRWLRFAGRAGSALYSLVLPAIVGNQVSQCDVLKTNQMDGSLPALICSWIWRRQVYVRTGYTLSRIVSKTSPGNWLRHSVAYINEFLAFRCASVTSVSSRFDMEYVSQRYGNKITAGVEIVGNYVNTELFSPSVLRDGAADRVLYVGRLAPEKNLANAIVACVAVGVELDIVGAGVELPHLKEVVAECGARVRWLGVIPNKRLPKLFQKYKYFILPSHWEGLPKSLIEAMSAGLVCIGNNTTGISEIIEDGVNGYLSPSADAVTLAKTLLRALEGDKERISYAGRKFICSEFSLEVIAAKEQAIFMRLMIDQ